MAKTFGVTVASEAASYGLQQSSSKTDSAELAMARTSVGKVDTQVAYTKKQVAEVEVIQTGALPGVGTSATLMGVTGNVTEVSQQEQNTEYCRGRVQVELNDAATVVAYSA